MRKSLSKLLLMLGFLTGFALWFSPSALALVPPCTTFTGLQLERLSNDLRTCPANGCFTVVAGDVSFCNVPAIPQTSQSVPKNPRGVIKCTYPDPNGYTRPTNLLLFTNCLPGKALCYFDTGNGTTDRFACQPAPPSKRQKTQIGYVSKGSNSIDPNCTPADVAAGKCTQAEAKLCSGNRIETAIGCISTEPRDLIGGFILLATSIGGGVAFVLMIIGAFRMIISKGDEENLANGKQLFMNATIGLLFVIFATIMVEIIGIDILNLPGFSRK